MAIKTGLTSNSPDPATILLKPLSPPQIPQTVSPEGTVTQEPVSRDNTTLFMDQEVTATQEPATGEQECTKHNESGRPAVAETQEQLQLGINRLPQQSQPAHRRNILWPLY